MPKKSDKLKDILRNLNKKYGKNTVYYANDEKEKERFPFNVKVIDEFIGGGIPVGNFTIIYGASGVGKSTLAYTQIAYLQKKDLVCCLLDLEHSFDPRYAEKIGIDNKKLILISPDNAEEAMDIIIQLCKEKVVNYICLDSIQALTPVGENETSRGLEKSMEKNEMALLARQMGKFLRRIGTPVYKANIGFLFIGQTRTQGLGTFFTTEGLSGGHALKHWASLILKIQRGMKSEAPKVKKEIVGFSCIITIEKHKLYGCSPANSKIQIPFYFDGGFYEKKEEENSSKKKGKKKVSEVSKEKAN
ncbi:hypothetical protein DRN69_03325 [Candidatus Pacearchaeota archaeon]|nr:MAG: hypothetical protein DRN69_03325 [Candidatus Pacearchaeota archaeon]